MPEIELNSDPFGAGRGKTFMEQGAILSARVKQHIHEKYYIPPYRPTNRNWEMTFASLGYNRKTIEKFWRLFCQINHSTGAIQFDHFLVHFGLDWTPWTERCFTHFDTTGGGDVDFLEFMISVWNVCTFKIDSLSNFTFDMYDLDLDGELSIPEIERMVKELFGEGGGKQCLKAAIEFAEARGGALNLNSFIAFTGSHQLLLFPIFQIQRKLQRKVFGIRFWEKVERSSKENFNDQNKNEFNPRHVQILLRTYQTGGAAAVLSHTGDPNKGLRDWYENQKPQENEADIKDETENGNRRMTGQQRWNLVRERVTGNAKASQQWSSIKRNILDGKVNRQNVVARIKEHKERFKRKTNGVGGAEENDGTQGERPTSANIPANVAMDLKRIRERRKEKLSKDGQRPLEEANENDKTTPSSRPNSASLPANVANDLKRIREMRAQKGLKDEPRPGGMITKDTTSRPNSAELPPNVAADLQRIRARRARKAASDKPPSKVKRRDRSRPKTTAIHNNVRQRQAGAMFFKSDAKGEGQPKGWLE